MSSSSDVDSFFSFSSGEDSESSDSFTSVSSSEESDYSSSQESSIEHEEESTVEVTERYTQIVNADVRAIFDGNFEFPRLQIPRYYYSWQSLVGKAVTSIRLNVLCSAVSGLEDLRPKILEFLPPVPCRNFCECFCQFCYDCRLRHLPHLREPCILDSVVLDIE